MISGFKKRGDRRHAQPHLFKPAAVKREARNTYDAIIFLRKRGMVIHRVSASQSRVDGKFFTSSELTKLARSQGWDG